MANMMSLGGTIPLPGYANIKIEVSGEGYAQTKEYLRAILLQMCITEPTAMAIATWWMSLFDEQIYNQV